MKIAIMQPTYVPWLGYFDLMDQVDHFVLLDDVQFSRQSWQQRNRIKASKGLRWLTVPIRRNFGQSIAEVELHDIDFWKSHAQLLESNYGQAQHYHTGYPGVRTCLETASASGRLLDLNIGLISHIASALGIETPTIRSSEMNIEGDRCDRLAEICLRLNGTRYISPLGAADYLLDEKDALTARGIVVLFQHYEHPEYSQLFPPFAPFASILDLILNEGPRSLEIVRSGRRTPFQLEKIAKNRSK